MLKRICCGVGILLSLGVGPASAQPGAGDQVESRGRLVQDLSGYRWKLKRMRPGEGVRQGLDRLPEADIGTSVWMPARVPGDVPAIEPDSAARIADFSWDIAGQADTRFHVHLALLDGHGRELSHNRYMLLIGDQARARERMKAMGQTHAAAARAYTYGNYYRFFREMTGQDGRDWEGQAQTPRAATGGPAQRGGE